MLQRLHELRHEELRTVDKIGFDDASESKCKLDSSPAYIRPFAHLNGDDNECNITKMTNGNLQKRNIYKVYVNLYFFFRP